MRHYEDLMSEIEEVEKAIALIEQERITYFAGVPTMSWKLLRASQQKECDLSSLVGVGAGGAAHPLEHVKRGITGSSIRTNAARPPEHVKLIAEKIPGTAGMGWGLTETNALGASNAGLSIWQDPPASFLFLSKPNPNSI